MICKKVVNLAKKTHKQKIKKDLSGLILIVIIVIMIVYVGYINKDKFFPEKIPKTTIIVNDELIDSEELSNDYEVAIKQTPTITMEDFLEQTIITTLLLQRVNEEGISVDDDEVADEIGRLMLSFGSGEELNYALNEMGITDEMLRAQIKKQLLINKLIDEEIVSKIDASDSEVKSFYDNNQELMKDTPFDDVKDQIKSALINEKTNSALEAYIKQLRANADIIVGEEVKKTKLKNNKFTPTNDDVCKKNNKPVIRLFSTTTCPQCSSIKDVFDSTVKEFVKEGKISAYHWELDTGDNTLTLEEEDGIPGSEVEIFKKYNSESTVPTYVFGCKYVRIGNAYEETDLVEEKKEIVRIIEKLIN